ncbi:hypothetical protein ACFXMF_38800 [Embleya sp. NPDC059213]|uniref:hypothetical protein n=1 Tax=Embleya sp. NPDC059213 TaxID=3346771 RepID=UPI0036A6CF98
MAQSGVVSLRGLPDPVVAEVLYGMQQRVAAGLKHRDHQLRTLCDLVRAQRVGSLADLDLDSLDTGHRRLAKGLLKHVGRFRMSPETERHKDVWDGVAFGLNGERRFDAITQPWLRQATKNWALDNAPRRRGKNSRAPMQQQINAVARLSESLRLHRDDDGADPRLLGRADVVTFLLRLRRLEERGGG